MLRSYDTSSFPNCMAHVYSQVLQQQNVNILDSVNDGILQDMLGNNLYLARPS